MKIDLHAREVYKILEEKFGEASFALYFVENSEGYEKRTGKEMSKMERPPEVRNSTIYLDKDKTIVP